MSKLARKGIKITVKDIGDIGGSRDISKNTYW